LTHQAIPVGTRHGSGTQVIVLGIAVVIRPAGGQQSILANSFSQKQLVVFHRSWIKNFDSIQPRLDEGSPVLFG
jgi:hypothetical protein